MQRFVRLLGRLWAQKIKSLLKKLTMVNVVESIDDIQQKEVFLRLPFFCLRGYVTLSIRILISLYKKLSNERVD